MTDQHPENGSALPEVQLAQRLEDFRGRAGSLRVMLESPGWAEMRSLFLQVYKLQLSQLLDPAQKRKDEISDDYLRGRIEFLAQVLHTPLDLLERFNKIVADADADLARLRAEGEAPDAWTSRAAELGIRLAGFPIDPDFPANPEGSES